jgi:hypothetical protein
MCRNPSRFAAAMSEDDAPLRDFSADRSCRANLAASLTGLPLTSLMTGNVLDRVRFRARSSTVHYCRSAR